MKYFPNNIANWPSLIVYIYIYTWFILLLANSIYALLTGCYFVTFGNTGLTPAWYNDLNYNSIVVSDWLINYEGGFTRRGLIGEILYQCYKLYPFPIKTCIFTLNLISFGLFCVLFWRICRKNKFTILPFLAIFCETHCSTFVYRRDFILFLLAYLVFFYFFKFIKTKKTSYAIVSNVTICLAIIIHESFFFFTIPLLLITLWTYSSAIPTKKVILCITYFTFPLIAMLSVSIFKGNADISANIWNSWKDLFTNYPDTSSPQEIGDGVFWLSKNLDFATSFHLSANFRTHYHNIFIISYCIAGLLSLLLMTLYLVIKNPSLQRLQFNYERSHYLLGLILAFQFLAMTPMFTILSCDYARTVLYCVVSTILYYNFLVQNPVHTKSCTLISSIYHHSPIQSVITQLKNYCPKKHHYIYPIILLIYPIHITGCIHIPMDFHIINLITELFTH